MPTDSHAATLIRQARQLIEQANQLPSTEREGEQAEMHLLLQEISKLAPDPESRPKVNSERPRPQPSGFPPPPISLREIFDTPEPRRVRRHDSGWQLNEILEDLKKKREEREKNPPWEPRPLLPETENLRRMLGLRLGSLFPIHPDDVEEAIRRGYIPEAPKGKGEGNTSDGKESTVDESSSPEGNE